MPAYTLSSIITTTSAVIGAATAAMTLEKIIDEVKQRDARRFEERMMAISTDLATHDEIHKTSGALAIMGLCNSHFAKYHDQVLYMILSLLKEEVSPSTHRVLVKSLEMIARRKWKKCKWEKTSNGTRRVSERHHNKEQQNMDLGRAHIRNVNLSCLELRKADLGFADLSGGNFSYADLYKARGIKVKLIKANLFRCNLTEARLKYAKCNGANFSQAVLKTAFLEEGDFRGANFGGAALQSAHFHKAKLAGARFEGADINEAYFVGVEDFDEITISGLLRTKNRYTAKFGEKLRVALAAASGES